MPLNPLKRTVNKMKDIKDIKKDLEEHYMKFITIAAGAVAIIALVVWGITYFVKKVKNNDND